MHIGWGGVGAEVNELINDNLLCAQKNVHTGISVSDIYMHVHHTGVGEIKQLTFSHTHTHTHTHTHIHTHTHTHTHIHVHVHCKTMS